MKTFGKIPRLVTPSCRRTRQWCRNDMPPCLRDELILATKGHARMGEGPNDWGNSRRHILKQCDESLKRLETDYIDLYQIHRPMKNIPIDETLRVLDDLVKAGKVRYIGTSTF